MGSRWPMIAVVVVTLVACTEQDASKEASESLAGSSGSWAQDGAGSGAAAGGGPAPDGRDRDAESLDAGAEGDAAMPVAPTGDMDREPDGIDPDAGMASDDLSDAAVPQGDAALDDFGDAGMGLGFGSGSCCAEHGSPGCSNADLQVCVCELLPSCCTEAWGPACVLIVEQKYCQPGVRECVCGSGATQWGQASCCEVEWTDVFCDQVAEDKCGATPGCS